ncbi:IS66 family insertion sequence element accessory protein TnpB [Cupriavidus taiwanensis]|uniref:Transposase IS66 Orf2 like protein n=1 Tax=Cupriavidus taiwanensis TaxID=164546 RepID=A0A375JFA7_9BURK|nr:IS66 family insertion sequence element accessory protein TnpB [Cupriavidus taiwanensis]SPS02820.1 transposase IS66 Orf2 like protein [Cupriavidus taiwanensis]
MFRFDEGLKVYLHREARGFSQSINGLSALVEQSLGLDPFAQAVYVFPNWRADRIKLLGWDRNGYWLFLKRLEADRFAWPRGVAVATLSVEQLHWLLDGIYISAVQRHPPRHYQRAV